MLGSGAGARCIRHRDPRADRQAEHTQLDVEMSFADEDEVLDLAEKMFVALVKDLFPEKKISQIPFPRLTWKESMEKYGTDKPDLRNPLIIQDVTEIFKDSEFNGFKDKTIKAIRMKEMPRSSGDCKE